MLASFTSSRQKQRPSPLLRVLSRRRRHTPAPLRPSAPVQTSSRSHSARQRTHPPAPYAKPQSSTLRHGMDFLSTYFASLTPTRQIRRPAAKPTPVPEHPDPNAGGGGGNGDGDGEGNDDDDDDDADDSPKSVILRRTDHDEERCDNSSSTTTTGIFLPNLSYTISPLSNGHPSSNNRSPHQLDPAVSPSPLAAQYRRLRRVRRHCSEADAWTGSSINVTGADTSVHFLAPGDASDAMHTIKLTPRRDLPPPTHESPTAPPIAQTKSFDDIVNFSPRPRPFRRLASPHPQALRRNKDKEKKEKKEKERTFSFFGFRFRK